MPASAHRLDEYLQAARIAIDPDRVHIELDLTPGVAVARGILADLDADRDGTFTADEARAYAARMLREIRLELDGQPLTLALTDSRAPAADAILRGEGVIRLQLTAAVPLVAAGPISSSTGTVIDRTWARTSRMRSCRRAIASPCWRNGGTSLSRSS